LPKTLHFKLPTTLPRLESFWSLFKGYFMISISKEIMS
jgi:hypothetical protein